MRAKAPHRSRGCFGGCFPGMFRFRRKGIISGAAAAREVGRAAMRALRRRPAVAASGGPVPVPARALRLLPPLPEPSAGATSSVSPHSAAHVLAASELSASSSPPRARRVHSVWLAKHTDEPAAAHAEKSALTTKGGGAILRGTVAHPPPSSSFPSSPSFVRRRRPPRAPRPPSSARRRLLDLAKDPRHELRGELFRHRPVVPRLSQRGRLAVHPHAGPQLNLDAKRLERVARGDRRAGARLAHAVPEERREDGERRGDESRVDLRSNNLIG